MGRALISWFIAGTVPCISTRSQLEDVGDNMNTVPLSVGWRIHYASLINLAPTNPVMLHHVPRRLSAGHRKTREACPYGPDCDGWPCTGSMGDHPPTICKSKNSDLVMRESATFAWIPTLTSVSRQSIFSGKPPLYFPSSINSTNSEERLWKQFWEGYRRIATAGCRLPAWPE